MCMIGMRENRLSNECDIEQETNGDVEECLIAFGAWCAEDESLQSFWTHWSRLMSNEDDGVSVFQFGANDCTAKGYCFIVSASWPNVSVRAHAISDRRKHYILRWHDPENWAAGRVLHQEC